MSYPKDLQDYTDAELQKELAQRQEARAEGRCDYCGYTNPERECKYPDRHKLRIPCPHAVVIDNVCGECGAHVPIRKGRPLWELVKP